MIREVQFRRNLKYAVDLLAWLIEHPEDLDRIPNGASLVAMPADDPELCVANEALLR